MFSIAPIRGKKPAATESGPAKSGEEGFVLLGVIILLALFVISLSVAAPIVARQIQRDRDLETMHRGKQYIRAIQLYYRRFHAYPPNIEALVKTNEIRFLRKRYIDPTTGKDDWKPIAFGQNKAPIAMGFFGQPLAGAGGDVIAGTGPSGGNALGSTIGSSGSSTISGLGGSNSPTGTTGSTGSSSSTLGGGSQTFGGAGIIGVSPVSARQSILVYKKKNHYNEWEFTYSPAMEMKQMPGSGGGGTLPTGSSGGSGLGFGTSTTSTNPTGSN